MNKRIKWRSYCVCEFCVSYDIYFSRISLIILIVYAHMFGVMNFIIIIIIIFCVYHIWKENKLKKCKEEKERY